MERAPYIITNLIMKCVKITYPAPVGTVHDKLLINSSHTQPTVKTQSHIQYVLGLKQPWRETDPSPLTMAMIKDERSSVFMLSIGTTLPLQQLTQLVSSYSTTTHHVSP
jgi:hypothetical protein